MDTEKKIKRSVATVSPDVGGAVGMDQYLWYVAFVGNNTEKSSSRKLEKMGIECYVPLQQQVRVWANGKKVITDRIVIPTILFVHCSETQRRDIVNLPFINRFMVNRAGTPNTANSKPIAVIPDNQIQQLKFMVCNSDTPVTLTSKPLHRGDRVRVIRGKLAGLEGEVMDMSKGRTELVVTIDFFGCAKLDIDTLDVEKIV